MSGCGDDASDVPAQLVGGWSNADAQQFACFAADGRMWIGDSLTELQGTSSCRVQNGGAQFECTDPDDGGAFSGTLQVTGDDLALDVASCPVGSDSCRASYRRDTSLACE